MHSEAVDRTLFARPGLEGLRNNDSMAKRGWLRFLWLVVAGAAVFWGLRLWVEEPRPEPVVAMAGAVSPAEPSRGIGQDPPPLPPAAAPDPIPAGRFQLFRVGMSPKPLERETVAVIGIDGLPPKTFRVGDTVVGAVVLQSIEPHSAALGPAGGPAAVVLQVLPPGTSPGALQSTGGDGSRRPQPEGQPPIRAASAPPVNREAVPVSDPDHGVDTSNH